MSDTLKQRGGDEALEKPIAVEARFAEPAHVPDLRARKYVGRTDTIAFTIDAWQPSLFALLRGPVSADTVIDDLLAR